MFETFLKCICFASIVLITVCPVDHVFEQILNSSSPELAEARQILRNIICRRLYKCLGQTQADKPIKVTQVCVCLCIQYFFLCILYALITHLSQLIRTW